MTTQARVSNWVHSQETEEYTDPFRVPPKEQSSRKLAKSPTRSHSSATSSTTPTKPTSHPRTVRPRGTPTRSRTEPTLMRDSPTSKPSHEGHGRSSKPSRRNTDTDSHGHHRARKSDSDLHHHPSSRRNRESHRNSDHRRQHQGHRSSHNNHSRQPLDQLYTIDASVPGRKIIRLKPDSLGREVKLPYLKPGEVVYLEPPLAIDTVCTLPLAYFPCISKTHHLSAWTGFSGKIQARISKSVKGVVITTTLRRWQPQQFRVHATEEEPMIVAEHSSRFCLPQSFSLLLGSLSTAFQPTSAIP